MKARKRGWPDDLKSPIVIKASAASKAIFGSFAPAQHFKDELDEQMRRERQKRVGIIAKFLGCKNPAVWSDDWADLVGEICKHWQIPAFQQPMKKESRAKWNDQKLCELFADVCWVRERYSSFGDSRACKYIAEHRADYGSRYYIGQKPDKTQISAWAKTLYRQFLNLKQKLENAKFRHTHFGTSQGPGLLNQHAPEDGPDLRRIAIERYASKKSQKVA